MDKNTSKQNFKYLEVRGAKQNNLDDLDLDIPLNQLTVITGVSGSGKSSLAFDTIYAEGQRRYVETFSPYARQFLDRMDRPNVESVDNVPPAVAIDQINPVRTTRSTVGTMTEINDYLKLLFARVACLYCPKCGKLVKKSTTDEICDAILERFDHSSMIRVMFPIRVPRSIKTDYAAKHLENQGYTRIAYRKGKKILVIQDRLRPALRTRSRLIEAIEVALFRGTSTVIVQQLDDKGEGIGEEVEFTDKLRCCGKDYSKPTPNSFSFNSAIGACETCKGFGRVMGIDYGQVIPDETLSLREGAIRPFNSSVYGESYYDLLEYGDDAGIPLTTPWKELSAAQKKWVIEGEDEFYSDKWYGVKRFFDWQENRKHHMHVRIFLSKYRAYSRCGDCDAARLKPDAFNWRLGLSVENIFNYQKFRHPKLRMTKNQFEKLPGLTIHDVASMPISRCAKFFADLELPSPYDEAVALLLDEIRARFNYLDHVGLGYLNLDRQARTLSGGEVQRINLTTALGTALVNTLFVLDEPTIGLHSRDIGRIIKILHRLRDAGNSLLVVEHEEQVIRAADCIIDLGPGPGKSGGKLVHFGTVNELLQSDSSVTADWLRNGRHPHESKSKTNVAERADFVTIKGAKQHNLNEIDVSIPLNQLVCVTGVSGSGKSTLVEEILFRGVSRHLGKATETPGQHQLIEGMEKIDDIVMVTQAAIGKNIRATPFTTTDASMPIRGIFSRQPLARQRRYWDGHFSFNSELGRCPTCEGSGYEHIEMQFLSDVYLPCESCNGTRYRSEVLHVKFHPTSKSTPQHLQRPLSIVDVLDLTVAEAIQVFGDDPKVVAGLTPLVDVGLDYLTLGQPVPTLSGGEAQRLKLATHIAKKTSSKRRTREHILFIFDEPTTGLHFVDVFKLVRSLRKLIDAGHSVIVIEHNLDVVSCADWLIDLGPEGGEFGGCLVAEGPPKTVADGKTGATAEALREYFDANANQQAEVQVEQFGEEVQKKLVSGREIAVQNAREHNLKDISVSIPYDAMTVITGMSGSGKSTLAFDILFAEGQKRYLATINAYARQFVQPPSRADFDSVTGLPPTVAISQMISRGGRRSTVATLTEVYHYIRLLYVRFGTQYCPDCDIEIHSRSIDSIIEQVIREKKNTVVALFVPLVVARKGNHNQWCDFARRRGAQYLLVDGKFQTTYDWQPLDRYREHSIDLPIGNIEIADDTDTRVRLTSAIYQALELKMGHVRMAYPVKGLKSGTAEFELFSTSRSCPGCGRAFEELDPRMFSYNSSRGWCDACQGTGLEPKDEEKTKRKTLDSETDKVCAECDGKRLNPESLAVRFHDIAIDEMIRWSVGEARHRLSNLDLSDRERIAARDIFSELSARLEFLERVGLSYLTLDRAAPTLSGGEAQRIRVASQLGSSLCGACYVLDEPTIGLHSRDNKLLLSALQSLKGKGNTIVVVEHDEATITQADYIIDLGPAGGVRGGEVVATGTISKIQENPASITGQMIKFPLQHPMKRTRSKPSRQYAISVKGVHRHNLINVNVTIPLKALVCVTGVSGSGKSTLVREVLYHNLARVLSKKSSEEENPTWQNCKNIVGWEQIRRVLEVDQKPIGKTPRSCPATYVNIWTIIRELFAQTAEARLRGYSASRFSFNVEEGRCSMCGGQGERKIEMNFLPDVRVLCESCGGARFNQETLGVHYRDKTIAEVLDFSVEEAQNFFSAIPSLERVLGLLVDVGLGYLRLGQPSPTLSGGEAQRIKLVSELSKALSRINMAARTDKNSQRTLGTLYLLDEPTVGLHAADVERLLKVIHALVDAGNTVVVIEHNLDVISEADWVIDMGPEGGAEGGKVVVQGNLAKLRKTTKSYTGQAVQDFNERLSAAV